jgi:Alw26I/Eco31I/Esp3I family type II restriction endonuclease
LAYKEMIVGHANYAGMPGARFNGRIQWQVSSGKATSFNTFYEPRRKWWTATADRLGIPGTGDEQGRFTIAARRIHPTGVRPCLHCGQDRKIGYYYANRILVKRLRGIRGFPQVNYLDGVASILDGISRAPDSERLQDEFWALFPERADVVKRVGRSPKVFDNTREISSPLLSPGYMGDPPDRFDGLHDYCVFCRREKDPARHPERMARYNQDRRVFEWWVEGDWELANTVYNIAGAGVCAICGAKLRKVSPDHVGPLSCGFKHLPWFIPLCKRHQSAKNRRMSLRDVRALVAWEESNGESVASWQVRDYWDYNKLKVSTDAEAKLFSDFLRVVEDVYLRVLRRLLNEGKVRFLVTLLNLEPSTYRVELIEPRPSTLEFSGYRKIPKDTKLRHNQPGTIIRRSLDALEEYFDEEAPRRLEVPERTLLELEDEIVRQIRPELDACGDPALDAAWAAAFDPSKPEDVREGGMVALLRNDYRLPCDERVRKSLAAGLRMLTSRYPPF